MSSQFGNFVELLKHRAQQQPDQTVFTFIQDEETELDRLTYRQLDQHAQKIAAKLQSLNAQGQRALLLYQPSLEYIAAFCGCLYAGVVAVPAYPPRANKSMDRLEAIVNDAEATIALTSANIKTNIENKLQLTCLATDELPLNLAENWQNPEITSANLAFLQYTSGSTGNPKGVMVSHGNLLHNSHLINLCFQDTPDSRGVSWLPPYHDMGLIGGILQPIYVGASMVLMSPVTFLQRPYRWLKAITKYKATTSGGPNFAYDLCINQITEEQKASLDLSSWTLAFTGAEPVRNETLAKFAATFADCGFKKEAFYPCYGMAETTLIVSGGEKNGLPPVKTVNRERLQENKVVTDASEKSITLVGCGTTIADQAIAIVNPDTLNECADNEIGEIWVSGHSVTQGYWQKSDLTDYTYYNYLHERGPFLRTGDLGFLADGELFVTGRLKDLIIIRGRNYYPQDIEATVENAHPALKESSSAAFAVEVDGEEKLVVVAEVLRTYLRKLNPEPVCAQIRKEVSLNHELQIHSILLLKTGSIPKTSSGKIRRHACKKAFLAGSLDVVGSYKQNIHEFGNIPLNRNFNDLENWLIQNLAQRLGIAPHSLDVNEPFNSYGLDSVQAVRLTAELEDYLNIKVSPTLAYDYPTIASLSQYLTGINENKRLDQYPISPLESEDIAIVGVNCRLPNASCWQEAQQMLASGKEATSPVPPDRWQGEQFGAFLADVDKFDAKFFGISPREATYMDPQQRLLLEVVWTALEDACIPPHTLKQSMTGVFVGVSSNDYSQLQLKYGIPVNAYGGTGNAHSIAANRLSYILDLRGPSLAVDTACSSSLVAVHLACNSLKQGESNLAIVGGVNLILAPELTETFTEAGMMASDGKCKTFDATADGYVRGEGCGVVVLKRLSDAVSEGDRVYAVIKGSAINQDGRSNGLTAPNGLAQEEVICQALKKANISPTQVDYIETHGTGTPIGDPIEVNALKRVFSSRKKPCYMGSIKTNVGHLEAAAGIVGLIKVVLSLQNEQIFPHLNFSKLNPLIDLGDVLSIPTQLTPWPKTDLPRVAGVSSFGFGGTNAHVILADPPPQLKEDSPSPSHFLLTLSAKNEIALRENVKNYVNYLTNNPDLCVRDLCLTSNIGRSPFPNRIAVVTKDTETLVNHLSSYLQGDKTAKVLQGKGLTGNKLAFLFTGQGSQYAGMGIKLYSECEVFKKGLDECASILAPELDRPLGDIIREGGDLLDETVYTQPSIFAIEYALGKVWQHWGINPAAVMGHSVGEYVAAVFAGVFSLKDGLKLIATRGRLMQKLAEKGEMLAVFAGEKEVKETISGLEEVISIAAINGDRNIVVSGSSLGIKTVIERLKEKGISSKKLQVSHGFHSPLMTGVIEEFKKVAEGIKYNLPTMKIVSNLTGEVIGEEIATPEYWVNHILKPVLFSKGIETLYKEGFNDFLEIGAKPILLGMIKQNNGSEKGLYLPSLRPNKCDLQQMLNSLANFYVGGYNINGQNFAEGITFEKISLPTYPFQRERYWFDRGDISVRVVNQKSSLKLDWLYQVEWKKQDRINRNTSESKGNWLIFADEGGFGAKLAQQFHQNGEKCELIYQNNHSFESKNYHTSEITGIIHLWSLNIEENNLTESESPISSVLQILQQNLAAKLWIITRNSLPLCLKENSLSTKGEEKNNPSSPSFFLTSEEEGKNSLSTKGEEKNNPSSPSFFLTSQEEEKNSLSTKGEEKNNPSSFLLTSEREEEKNSLSTKGEEKNSPSSFFLTSQEEGKNLFTSVIKEKQQKNQPNLLQSTMWGLGKVIELEHPENWGGIIDIDNSITPELLLTEIKNTHRENQIILRENSRFVPRLIPAKIPQREKFTIKSDVTYLITGGLGDLGLKLTSFLVEKGAKNIVLLSRNNPSEHTKNFLNNLSSQGVNLLIKPVDLTDLSQLETVFTEIKTSLPPLKGIFHLAGILHDGLLQRQTWENFSLVMSPKVEGSWNLHNLTKNTELDCFVMFSSVSSLVGSPGQGNYASGNAFLDSMSYYRHSLGLPSLTVNWGPLNTGMAEKTQLSVRGFEKIDVNQGFELLLDLISAKIPQIGVISVDWKVLKQQFPIISPYFSVLLPEEEKPEQKTGEIFALLLENSPQEREEFLTEYLQKTLAEILQLDQEKLSVTDSLLDLGMDSLMVMEAINLVKSDLKLMIYPREFYERPKIIQLAKYLASEFSKTHISQAKISEKPAKLEVIFKQNSAKYSEVKEKIDQPIAFILSSPRSGSTLLRVMLAGHPALFAPPELHLLPFENMQEREKELSSSYLGEGLKKAFMELKRLTPEESEKFVQKLVEDNVTIPEIYTILQNLAGAKLLIDKSPTYSSQKSNLEKSAKLFTNAKYIHLIRHPYSVIESFARLRMDKLLTTKDVNPYSLAESIWSESNQNTLDLAGKIDDQNYLAVRYEDLVTNPQAKMTEICNFLGVNFDESVLQPYQGERLTAGMTRQSLSVGDPNFLKHKKIEAELANKWRNIVLPFNLNEKTVQLSEKFDYEIPTSRINTSASMQRDEINMEETYLDVRGLQLCLCSWGPKTGPVVLCLHGILEQGAAWLDVAVRLAQKGYRVIAPDLRGHGKSDHVGKGGSYNLLDFLGDIDVIASNLTNKPFTLVGHSLGSVVAAMFASVRPQKIEKLVLVETILPTESSDEETAESLANHLDYLASPPKHQVFPDLESAAERLRLATPALSAKKALQLAQRILEPCQGGFRWRWASILLTRAGIGFNGISKAKYLGLLKYLQIPITLIYGNNSNFNRPEDLEEQEKAMPNAYKIVISGGHNLHLESGEQLAEIISM
jgi:acyl transferase domain-containing protein/acyl-CoA synthetase (AMP-forming)/AMP-acid ligase II/acyl carrier protein/predicted alpha/beta-fold hydrolase